MTGAPAAAVVPCQWVRCTLSRPDSVNLLKRQLLLLLRAFLRKVAVAQASM